MNFKFALMAFSVVGLVSASQAQLFGVGHTSSVDTFYSIDTTTGAATALFNIGSSVNVQSLTYDPFKGKFYAVRVLSASSRRLLEIDPVAQTATLVTTQIPTTMFEAVEYSMAQGGLVVSYGATSNTLTTSLALLDTNFNLLATRSNVVSDMDNIFVDENGELNKMDTNNLSPNQRQRIINPFTGTLSTPTVGGNIFSVATDSDFAYSPSESRMFMSRSTSLATVNTASTAITTVGAYGLNGAGTAITISGLAAITPVPEPATMAGLILGIGAILRKRRKSS